MSDAHVYCDASIRPEGGVIAGWVIKLDDRRVAEGHAPLPRQHQHYDLIRSSSAAAELWAIEVAARKLLHLQRKSPELGHRLPVVFFCDAEGVVSVLKGTGKTGSVYRPLVTAVLEVLATFVSFRFEWLSREENREANHQALGKGSHAPNPRRGLAPQNRPEPLRAPLSAIATLRPERKHYKPRPDPDRKELEAQRLEEQMSKWGCGAGGSTGAAGEGASLLDTVPEAGIDFVEGIERD